MTNIKKIFLISGILFVVVLGLWALYNFGFKNSASNPVADPAKREAAKVREAEDAVNPDGKIELVLNDQVVGATLKENSILYYSERNRELRRSDLDGRNTTTLSTNLPGTPTRLVWSPRQTSVLLLITTPNGPLWHSLDIEKKSLVPLRPEMSRLTWTNVGESILYQYTDPSTGAVSLNTANADGGGWKKLLDLERGDYFLSPIPRSSLISFWRRPNGLEENRLETVTLVGESRRTLFAGRFGTDFLWRNDGGQVLIGSVTEKGGSEPVLGLANENGGEYRDLGVPTLLSKVAWSGDNETIYYALPSPFPKGTVLPNDNFARKTSSKDTFWKMNTRSGKRERLLALDEINEAVDATDLFLSQDELILFFTDRTSGKLYRIDL